jgi:DNA-binding MarR family transcriptional regulator
MSATTESSARRRTGDTGAPALLTAEELGAWRGLLRVHARLTRALDAELVAEHGLPLSSYEVLLFLADSPGGQMRMSELADGVLLSRSGLTRLVDRMQRDGLLRRERCADDARGFLATITPKGRALFARARRTHLDGVHELFLNQLSAAEQRALGELWERVAPGSAS